MTPAGEIQRAPDLLSYIQALVDDNRRGQEITPTPRRTTGVDWPDRSVRLARRCPMQDRHPGRIADGQAPESDPVVDAYKRHIDRTLLRQNLRRTVTERVENLMALQRLAAEARRAGHSLRGDT